MTKQEKENINFFHILDGELTIYLFNPKYNKKLNLNKTQNLSVKANDINIRNPDVTKFPNFQEINKNTIQIKLRKGNILYIPNNWSYYLEYNQNTLLLNYCFHTVVSKIISYM